ncbi:patatin-like phospholipase family protein [Magnetospirillum molischianum]|uniref:PNPLA domain-containing protein n=1 Tax=Magnetospirillum molischianum DSM 120 TaxID=1150626 RepID=H8FQX3_MAGML|nr:patatin-like phospholipase family protein [Magnetospirillum molischianum]CCG40761.1 conserved exported hypothetical protein [Magnetospirillum molischianum DSM 120]
MTKETKRIPIGIAFQGGSFTAGAVATGVVTAFVKAKICNKYDVRAFSGTSAGALVAAICWDCAMAGPEGMKAAPEKLKTFWYHNAIASIPNQDWGDFWKSFDNLARLNPLYDMAADTIRIPWVQAQFRRWIETAIEPERVIRSLAKLSHGAMGPRLAIGAANVTTGDIATFIDQDYIDEAVAVLSSSTIVKAPVPKREVKSCLDLAALQNLARLHSPEAAYKAAAEFLLDTLMASGSLDEINGMTTIDSSHYQGTFLDGAWGQNPPVDVMIDFGVEEIWIVEIFPKNRDVVPRSHAEREDRKEELWQNSTIEQQVALIERVNGWISCGRVNESIKGSDRKFRQIRVRRLKTDLLELPGARIVNTPNAIADNIEAGMKKALEFIR